MKKEFDIEKCKEIYKIHEGISIGYVWQNPSPTSDSEIISEELYVDIIIKNGVPQIVTVGYEDEKFTSNELYESDKVLSLFMYSNKPVQNANVTIYSSSPGPDGFSEILFDVELFDMSYAVCDGTYLLDQEVDIREFFISTFNFAFYYLNSQNNGDRKTELD